MLGKKEISDIKYEIKSCMELKNRAKDAVENETNEKTIAEKKAAANSLLGRIRALSWVLEKIGDVEVETVDNELIV